MKITKDKKECAISQIIYLYQLHFEVYEFSKNKRSLRGKIARVKKHPYIDKILMKNLEE